MPIKTPVPSMSTAGFVYDPVHKVDILLSWFFVTRHLQDGLWAGTGRVLGVQQLIAEASNNVFVAAGTIKQYLQSYLEQYLTQVRVDVKAVSDDSTAGTLQILVDFVENGTNALGGWSYSPSTSVFSRVAVVNNTGEI
jgi:hypothetical protein